MYLIKQTLLDAQLPYTARITTKNPTLFFLKHLVETIKSNSQDILHEQHL